MIRPTRFIAFAFTLFATLAPSTAPGADEAQKAGAKPGKKPLEVFILAGQSNMQGHAKVSTFEHIGMDPATKPMLAKMLGADGKPKSWGGKSLNTDSSAIFLSLDLTHSATGSPPS